MGFRLRAEAVARYVSAVQTVILGSERFDCLPALLDRDPGGTPAIRALVYVGMSAGAHLAAPQPHPVVPVTGAQLIVVRGSRRSVIPAMP
jgi:hypothetical protein